MYRDKEPIPSQYVEMIHTLGLEATQKLCEWCGGDVLYIPKFDAMKRYLRRKKIRQEFNGENTAELAQKYRLSRRRIQQIVAMGY